MSVHQKHKHRYLRHGGKVLTILDMSSRNIFDHILVPIHLDRFPSEISNSSSATESSSATGRRTRGHRGRNGLGIFSWPADLKLLCSNPRPKNVSDSTDEKNSDIVYLTLTEAAARGRTASMSSVIGSSGSGSRHRAPRRGRPRRRCTSEPPMASRGSPKAGIGFSGAVESVVARKMLPMGSGSPGSMGSSASASASRPPRSSRDPTRGRPKNISDRESDLKQKIFGEQFFEK